MEADEEQMPRVVRVPLAGFVDVEIDPSIEVKHSRGWSESTGFEEAAVEAAAEAFGAFFDAVREAKVPLPTEYEWQIEAMPRITSGNVLHVYVNEIEDLGTE